MLNPGDRVTVVFNNRTYSGVVDPPGDAEVQEESGRSPTKSPPVAPASRKETGETEQPPFHSKDLTLEPRLEVEAETSLAYIIPA